MKPFVRKRCTSTCIRAQQDNIRAVLPQCLTMLLESRSDDDAVAERLEAVAVLCAGRPGDDLPGMNAEAQAKALAVLRSRAARSAQGAIRDLLRREAGLRGVVRPGNPRREQGEDSVAHVLHNHAVVRLDRRRRCRVVPVHHLPERVLAEPLRQRRRADHVCEHDRGILDVCVTAADLRVPAAVARANGRGASLSTDSARDGEPRRECREHRDRSHDASAGPRPAAKVAQAQTRRPLLRHRRPRSP